MNFAVEQENKILDVGIDTNPSYLIVCFYLKFASNNLKILKARIMVKLKIFEGYLVN